MPSVMAAATRFRSGRGAVLASFLLALALLALAAHEAPAASKYRVGLVSGVLPGDADLRTMRDLRARSVRIVFSWDSIETERRSGRSCGTASYDFSRYDELVSAAGRRSLEIVPTLMGSPKYAGRLGTRYPNPGTRAFEDFQCFVRAVVARYGRGGRYVGRDGARAITEWQVWNEPSLPLYNPGKKVSPRKYGQLVKATARSIRSRDGGATIVLAGIPEKTKESMSSGVFLRKLYEVKNIRGKFDAVALHPYAGNTRGVKGAVTRLREQLTRLGDRRRPIWITEVGFATEGRERYFLVTNEKGQARKLESTLRMLRKNHKRLGVTTVHWFRFRDLASYSEDTENWPDYAGIYRKDGSPKPACHRYRSFTGAGGKCQRIRSDEDSGGLPLIPIPLEPPDDLLPSPPP